MYQVRIKCIKAMYIAPKSEIESRAHYAPEPTQSRVNIHVYLVKYLSTAVYRSLDSCVRLTCCPPSSWRLSPCSTNFTQGHIIPRNPHRAWLIYLLL